MRIRCVGIDPSLTGLAIWTSNGDVGEFSSENFGPKATDRLQRYEALTTEVLDVLWPHEPELIVIEANQGLIKGNAIQLVEFSWYLKSRLLQTFTDCRLIEVPPTSLKKWVTGSGSADKAAVSSFLSAKYGEVLETNNQADAFGLLQFGRGLLGDIGTTKAQKAVYAKLELL